MFNSRSDDTHTRQCGTSCAPGDYWYVRTCACPCHRQDLPLWRRRALAQQANRGNVAAKATATATL